MHSCHGVFTNQFYIITFFERFWREFRISYRSHKPVRKLSFPRFGTEKQLGVFNNTCEVGEVGDFRVHLPSDDSRTKLTGALSEVDYGHTRHCEDC